MKRQALNHTIFIGLNVSTLLALLVHQQWFWACVAGVVVLGIHLYVDHILTQRYHRRRDILYRYLAKTHSYMQWQLRDLPELQKVYGKELADIWHQEMDEDLRRLSSVYCEDVLRPHMGNAFEVQTNPGSVDTSHPIFERL